MNKFINLYIFSLIIVILNISYINCSTITFNNNIIPNCNISNPCDLSSRSVWLNNELPIDGDDVVIDLSTLKSESGVYLTVSSFHINLNSFTFNGLLSTYSSSSLIISNSNLTVSTEFNINNSNITFYDDSNTKININITSFTSTLSNVITNGTCNLEIGTFNGVSGSLTVSNSSYLSVSGNAAVNVNVMQTSNNLLSFMGTTLISSQFYSNGNVQFNSQTTFTHSATLNVTFVNSELVIKNKSVVTLGSFLRLSDSSSIQVYESSVLMIIGPLVEYSNIVNYISLYNNSVLSVPSGFLFSNNAQMNGTIYINDVKYSSFLYGSNQPGLTIQSIGNITTLDNSTLGYLSMSNSSSVLNVKSQFNIYKANINSDIIIYSSGSLTTLTSLFAKDIYVLGVLNTECTTYASNIYIEKYGVVNVYDEIYSNVYSFESTISFDSNNGYVHLIDSSNRSTVIINDQHLAVQQNITVDGNSTIKFNNASLNSYQAMVHANGFINIDESTTIIIQLSSSETPKDGDKVKLVSTYSPSTNLDPNKMLVLAYYNSRDLILDIQYNIEQDGFGNLNLIFSKSDSIGLPNKFKVAIIVCIIVGAIVFISVLVVLIQRRNHRYPHNDDHHHHHNNDCDNSPLIH